MASRLSRWIAENGPLVIVNSAFEQIAATGSNCQSFLYTLFELTSLIPVTIICCTTGSADVLDLLEKRVKSRFSQTVIYLTHPNSMEAYITCLKQSLKPPSGDQSHPLAITYADSIERIFSDPKVSLMLADLYDVDRDPIISLTRVFLDPLLSCSADQPELRLNLPDLPTTTTTSFDFPDAIPPLSLAEQCCLVAWKRTAEKCPEEVVTFDALFEEYARGFAASAKVPDAHLLCGRFSRS
jgi:origin recognition complex subunit 4